MKHERRQYVAFGSIEGEINGAGYRKPCGYCSHPSRDDGVCGICGDVKP